MGDGVGFSTCCSGSRKYNLGLFPVESAQLGLIPFLLSHIIVVEFWFIDLSKLRLA